MRIHRPASIIAVIIVSVFFASVIVVAVSTTLVTTPANLQGWQRSTTIATASPTITPSVIFVPGPGTPPLGQGSVQFNVGSDGDNAAQLRHPGYNLVTLPNPSATPVPPAANELTSLTYSTYAQSGGSGGQTPFIILNIDNNNDGVFNIGAGDDQLFFEPVYQNGTYSTVDPSVVIPNQCGANPACVTPGEWQTWDAFNGGWWALSAGTFGPPLTTLKFYRSTHPNARIINSNNGTGGVRIVTGFGAGAWDNFVGNVDEFIIGVGPDETTYDFETWAVTSVSPTQNDLNVPRSSNVAATFDSDVDPTSVDQTTFTLRGSYTARYPGAYSFPTPTTVVLDPTNDFKPGEIITATATSDIRNSSGDLLKPFTWQFWAAATGGSGRLLPHHIAPQFNGGDPSRGLALGDLDGDGDLDAIVANGGGDEIVVEEEARTGPNGELVTCSPEMETVWINDGTGIFTQHLTVPCFGAGDSSDVALGDLDGDGDLDAVVSNRNSEAESVWFNNGSASFTPGGTFGAEDSTAVVLGDLDGDGDLDAVVANAGVEPETVWVNDGSGTFTPHPEPSFACEDSRDLALGDIDNDGDLDVVVANSFPIEGTTVWLNSGTGAFSPHPVTPFFGQGSTNTGVALGDLDDDGDLDAVVSNTNNEAETVWVNDGTGSFTPHANPAFGGENSEDIALGDLDGDGDLDAVVANKSGSSEPGLATKGANGSMTVSNAETTWLNNGAGVFTPHPSGPSFGGDESNAVALGDLDGDGDIDAVVANEFGGALSRTKAPAITIGGGEETVWINEADADGIPDATDNCPTTANADQADQDMDTVGDVCDNCVATANTDQADQDEDTVGDLCDNCIATSNSDQLDSDMDGPGDVCDNCPTISNPNQQDLNQNSIGDACEVSDLTITKTHSGNFNPGQTGTYTITVTNSGSGPTTGTVTVTDTVPAGLTPTGPVGPHNGWVCSISGQTVTCSRNDPLLGGASYPTITLTVQVADPAPLQATNVAVVSGGGESDTTNNTATDVTIINCSADTGQTNTNPLVISRFRENGPRRAQDEFVEVFNPTDAVYTVASGNCTGGIGLFASAGNGTTSNAVNLVCHIPNGTQIPARGYFLCTGVEYSMRNLGLNGGPQGATAVGDATIGCGGTCVDNIPDDAGLALLDVGTNIVTLCPAGAFGCPTGFNYSSPATSGNALKYDSVGFSPYGPGAPAPAYPSLAGNFCEGNCLRPVGDASTDPTCPESAIFPVLAEPGVCYGQAGQYEFLRRQTNFNAQLGTLHQDTNNNVNDILLVAPNSSSNMGLAVTGVSGVTAILGAAGPNDTRAPADIPSVDFTQAPFDTGNFLSPRNAERIYSLDPTVANPANDPQGTFILRLRFTNNSGETINGLRFRIDNLSTLCGPQEPTPQVGTANARNLAAAPDCGPSGMTAILKLLNSTREFVVDSTSTTQTVEGTVMEDLSATATPTPPDTPARLLSPFGGGIDNSLVVNPSTSNASVGDGVTGGTGQFGTIVANGSVIRIRIKFGVVRGGRFILLVTPAAKTGPVNGNGVH